MWLAGNHDRSVGENHIQTGWPSELIDLRNELMPRLPFMALFPDGKMAMHGGPPAVGSLCKQKNKRKLSIPTELRELMKQSRFVGFQDSEDDANCDHWFDADDLVGFVDFLKLPISPRMLIRGHDHPPEGYQLYSAYSGINILTLLGSSRIGVQFMPQKHRDWTTIGQLDGFGQIVVRRLFSDGTAKTH
jgi:hypothetical protein